MRHPERGFRRCIPLGSIAGQAHTSGQAGPTPPAKGSNCLLLPPGYTPNDHRVSQCRITLRWRDQGGLSNRNSMFEMLLHACDDQLRHESTQGGRERKTKAPPLEPALRGGGADGDHHGDPMPPHRGPLRSLSSTPTHARSRRIRERVRDGYRRKGRKESPAARPGQRWKQTTRPCPGAVATIPAQEEP